MQHLKTNNEGSDTISLQYNQFSAESPWRFDAWPSVNFSLLAWHGAQMTIDGTTLSPSTIPKTFLNPFIFW